MDIYGFLEKMTKKGKKKASFSDFENFIKNLKRKSKSKKRRSSKRRNSNLLTRMVESKIFTDQSISDTDQIQTKAETVDSTPTVKSRKRMKDKLVDGVYYPNESIKQRGKFLFYKLDKSEKPRIGKFFFPTGEEVNLDKMGFSAEGPGIITTKIGDVIQGNWKDDKLEGQISISHKGYKEYKVNCSKGMLNDPKVGLRQFANRDGKTHTIHTQNGERYVGNCFLILRHGKGVLYYPNGNKQYEGDWRADNRHGKGIEYYKDGQKVYEGYFKDDMRNGKGIEYDRFGQKIYEGEFKKDLRHGEGVSFTPEGHRHVGFYKNGMKQGRGRMFFIDGRVYNGEWVEDREEGRGVMNFEDGLKTEIEWVDGTAYGSRAIWYPDGLVYEGDLINRMRHGQGVLYGPKGEVMFRGHWINDRKSGKVPLDPNGVENPITWVHENESRKEPLGSSARSSVMSNPCQFHTGSMFDTNSNKFNFSRDPSQMSPFFN
jgi:antitoxin component YwqK of YwqJK toxin-antitoxin module